MIRLFPVLYLRATITQSNVYLCLFLFDLFSCWRNRKVAVSLAAFACALTRWQESERGERAIRACWSGDCNLSRYRANISSHARRILLNVTTPPPPGTQEKASQQIRGLKTQMSTTVTRAPQCRRSHAVNKGSTIGNPGWDISCQDAD